MTEQPASSPRIFAEPELRHLLAREVQRSTRYQDFLSVCLVRPEYAPAAGTDTQVDVARRIAELLRATDIIGSIGGDIVILLVHTPETDAVSIVDRIRDRIQAASFPGAIAPVHVTVSIGLASFPTDATSDAGLLDRAQARLPDPSGR